MSDFKNLKTYRISMISTFYTCQKTVHSLYSPTPTIRFVQLGKCRNIWMLPYSLLNSRHFRLWMVEIACKMSEIWLFFCFSYFQHFPSIFRVLRREKLYSLLDSWHFRLWMGEITWKMSEKWLAFRFLALSIKFSGFCPRRNLILSSILDILGFGLMKSHEK